MVTEIHTIDDLRAASQEEVAEVMASLDPLDDVEEYLESLNKPRKKSEGLRPPFQCPKCNGLGEIIPEPRMAGVFHPSSIKPPGIGCSRKLALDLMGFRDQVQDVWSPRMRRLLNAGHNLQDLMQGPCKVLWGEDYETEVSDGIDDLNLWGSCDARVGFHYCQWIHEIKTINDRGFTQLGPNPLDDHIWQGTIYMMIFDVPFCVFWYYNKNNSAVRQYVIPFNDAIWDAVEKKLQTVLTMVSNRVWPTRDVPGWKCRDCKYSPICKRGDPEW